MIFNMDEMIALTAALEEYSEIKAATRLNLEAEIIDEIACSCLDKLEHLSMLTYFTKQEYSIMHDAFNDVMQKLPKAGYEVPVEYSELLDKLGTLSGHAES